jgi:hypothetical protein
MKLWYLVGHQLTERYTNERLRFPDMLEIIKFVCTVNDMWLTTFREQTDESLPRWVGVGKLTSAIILTLFFNLRL